MPFNVNFLLLQKLKAAASSRVAHWLYPIVMFMFAYAMQRSVALLGLDLHHDAFMFDAAKRLLDGEMPYRDFFYQYNLGTVVFHMLALKVIGTYIASIKIATSVVYALISVAIYMCAAVMGRAWQGFGMAMLWSTLSPFHMPVMNGYHAWPTVYMMAGVMAGALFLLMATRSRPWLFAGLAGACFNFAFWFKQVAGLQILLVILWLLLNTRRSAVGEYTARHYRTMLLSFILGGIFSSLPFFGYLYANDLFYDWWRSAFVFNKYFALTGASSSDLSHFLHTIFPSMQRDMGYNSYLWMLLPLYLVAMMLGGRNKGGLLPLRTDEQSRQSSLMLMLGLAGWMEFFPLPHAFHMQLFMAPVFTLIAIGQINPQEVSAKHTLRRWMSPFMIVLMSIVIIESLVHLRGLQAKVTQTRVTLEDETPAKGLELLQEYATPFLKFYRVSESLYLGKERLSAIPMSGDPLRAIFPALNAPGGTFRMGVDWTWPNEIVEPGFNQMRSEQINKRSSSVYGDGVVAIPGYMPIALLEMPSPLVRHHSLYMPTADVAVNDTPVITVSRMYRMWDASDRLSESYKANGWHLICADPAVQGKLLVPYGKLSETLLRNVKQLHVTMISDSEVLRKLSQLEFEKFMVPAMAVFDKKISANQFYVRNGAAQFSLKPSLTESEWVYLTRFFLSRGKLYGQQYIPRFASTLALEVEDRPMLVTEPQDAACPRIVWSKERQYTGADAGGEELYLAVPEDRLVDNGPITMHVQIVLENNTTRSMYIRYGFEGGRMASSH